MAACVSALWTPEVAVIICTSVVDLHQSRDVLIHALILELIAGMELLAID